MIEPNGSVAQLIKPDKRISFSFLFENTTTNCQAWLLVILQEKKTQKLFRGRNMRLQTRKSLVFFKISLGNIGQQKGQKQLEHVTQKSVRK